MLVPIGMQQLRDRPIPKPGRIIRRSLTLRAWAQFYMLFGFVCYHMLEVTSALTRTEESVWVLEALRHVVRSRLCASLTVGTKCAIPAARCPKESGPAAPRFSTTRSTCNRVTILSA
jgi:hypothetical protein